jgi:hypothetical protein
MIIETHRITGTGGWSSRQHVAALLLSGALIAIVTAPSGAQTSLTKVVPEAAERAAIVRIEARGIPETVTEATVGLIPVSAATASCDENAAGIVKIDAIASPTSIVFTVPPTAPLGRYLLCVFLPNGERPLVAAGTRPFRVQSATVRLTGVTPTGVYPNETDDSFSFWLDGDGFSWRPAENVLIIDGHATRATVTPQRADQEGGVAPGQPSNAENTPEANVDVLDRSEPRQLLVTGLKLDDGVRGTRQVQIRVGTELSNARSLVFSWSSRWVPQVLATVGVLIAAVIVLALVALGLKRLGPNRPKFLAALLLENGAYSLGKLQFYAWTAVAVLGYLFLAFARSLVQGHPDLPDVPGGLPGLVGISAGTGVAAAAIGAISGTKGPAGTEPSIADLVVTGGNVVADRVQFLVWTFVTIIVFITVITLSDPAKIETLPSVPNGLLYLMGLSAAGYLGGKFLRRPAPDIVEVAGKDDQANKIVELTVKGRNLSKNPSVLFNGQVVAQDPSAALYFDPIDATVPEPGSGNELFQQLVIKVHYRAPILQQTNNQLVLVNPDGQSAKGEIKVGGGGATAVWQRPLVVL